MAATTAPRTTGNRINLAGSDRARSPMHPARKRLIMGVLLVLVGSFLPWLYVGGVPKSGALGPGLWSCYAGILGLAAVLMPWRRIAAGHALVMGAACVALPLWQLGHAWSLVGFGGWMPGPGVVMVGFGGIIALQCGWRLLREPATA